MNKIKTTLTSRKFWVVVASSALFGLNGDYEAAVGVWLGWAVMEGIIDASAAKKGDAIAAIALTGEEKKDA
jgi:hypothetical protein